MAKPKRSIADNIATLRKFSVSELQEHYREVYGRESRSRNRDWLFKRVAFRMRYGGLSERAQRRAKMLAKGASLRSRLPPGFEINEAPPPEPHPNNPRLPPIDTVLTKEHRGELHAIIVLAEDFKYRGETYPSLSRIANLVTGTSWNGFLWLGLEKRKRSKEDTSR